MPDKTNCYMKWNPLLQKVSTITDKEYQTLALLQHLDKVLQLPLTSLPDATFQAKDLVQIKRGKVVQLYHKDLSHKAGSLFDRVEVRQLDATVKKIVLRGAFPAVKEVAPLEWLVDDFVLVLGKDLFSKGRFTILDKAHLKQGHWKGRKWMLYFNANKRLPFIVDVLDGELQLCFYLPV